MTRKFRGVIFDADGVLVDSEPLHLRAWKQILEGFGIPFGEDEFLRVLGRTTEQILAEYFHHYGIQQDQEIWSVKKEEAYRALAVSELQPLDGVISFVRFLVDKGIRRAVASSAVRLNVDVALKRMGLEGSFDIILSVEDVLHPKPAPDIYLKAAAGLAIPPEECVIIEDSPPGVLSAKQAGAFVIGITTTTSRQTLAGADRIFDSFAQIREFLIPQLSIS